jgi:hypothetical protein
VNVRWNGLDEFRELLRDLPTALRDDADDILIEAANRAEAEIRRGYTRGKTGDLLAGLYQNRRSGPFGIAIRLINKAAHAWLWDNGTEARHYTTTRGKQHATGAMWGKRPAPHTFDRAVLASRRRMFDDLKAMMRAHGLEVRGEDDAAA